EEGDRRAVLDEGLEGDRRRRPGGAGAQDHSRATSKPRTASQPGACPACQAWGGTPLTPAPSEVTVAAKASRAAGRYSDGGNARAGAHSGAQALVLVVDDHPDIRLICAKVLEQ